jgi:hypothetical protein
MTTSELDRLSRILTDMRVESAAQFARLNERMNVVPELSRRITELESRCATMGRFTWSDVFKAAGAAAAVVAIYHTTIGA